ncbi:MAG TPA: hypothetical protein VG733_17695, partial [Chthoniobacteraceae bacterium]|nr:hypothetical protein [Chthoniobacteraceae bacterium]
MKRIKAQLDATIIPEIEIRSATLVEAIAIIMKKAGEAVPGSDPVPIVIDPDLLEPGQNVDHLGKLSEARLTLRMVNITESNLLDFVTRLAGVDYRITSTGVSIEKSAAANEEAITRRYSLPPEFPGVEDGNEEKIVLALAEKGAIFPPENSIHYDACEKILTVTNTEGNLAFIEHIIAGWRDSGPA